MANPPTQTPAQPDPDLQKNSAPQGAVTEADLAKALGVARGALKKLRAYLKHGEHWTGDNGAPIVITPAGQARLQELLRPAQESAGDGTAGDVETAVLAVQRPDRYTPLIVVKIGGTRVLLARGTPSVTPAEPPAGEVRVMVKAAANFLPGMRLDQCEPADTAGVYYFHGRLPRQKGRW